MYRRFITTVVSTALVITSVTAPPVQAGDDDIAKWIAGAAALAIIGAAIADKNDRKSKPRYNSGHGYNPYAPKPKHNHGYGHTHGYQNQQQGHAGHNGYNQGVIPRPNPLNPYLLPAQCRVSKNLQGHKIRGFSRRCLKRNNVNVKALPRECAVKFRDHNRDKRVVLYTGRCLKQYGYRVARAY